MWVILMIAWPGEQNRRPAPYYECTKPYKQETVNSPILWLCAAPILYYRSTSLAKHQTIKHNILSRRASHMRVCTRTHHTHAHTICLELFPCVRRETTRHLCLIRILYTTDAGFAISGLNNWKLSLKPRRDKYYHIYMRIPCLNGWWYLSRTRARDCNNGTCACVRAMRPITISNDARCICGLNGSRAKSEPVCCVCI